jgi:hypothetical protein
MGCNVVLFSEWFPTVRREEDDDSMILYNMWNHTPWGTV